MKVYILTSQSKDNVKIHGAYESITACREWIKTEFLENEIIREEPGNAIFTEHYFGTKNYLLTATPVEIHTEKGEEEMKKENPIPCSLVAPFTADEARAEVQNYKETEEKRNHEVATSVLATVCQCIKGAIRKDGVSSYKYDFPTSVNNDTILIVMGALRRAGYSVERPAYGFIEIKW